MTAREVRCPRCGKPALFTPENPFRPFCSERCKLIDLGDWADGRYAIPVVNPSEAAPAEESETSREAEGADEGSGSGSDSKH